MLTFYTLNFTRQPLQENTLVTPWWFENFIGEKQFFSLPQDGLCLSNSHFAHGTPGEEELQTGWVYMKGMERTHSTLLSSSSRTAFSWLSHAQNLAWEYSEGILLSVSAYPGSQESQHSQHRPASPIVHGLYLGASFNLHFVPQLVQKPTGLNPFRKALSFPTDGFNKVPSQPTA